MTQHRLVGNLLKWGGVLALSGSPNLAIAKAHLGTGRVGPRMALGEMLYLRQSRVTAVGSRRLHVHSLASARMRRGPRAWEVDRLLLGSTAGEAAELLDAVSLDAWGRGAERLYLRVRHGSSIVSLARLAGFFPCFEESLLQGEGGRATGSLDMRARQPHEEFAMFQLYSAATPTATRSMIGMSFDQWRDARDPASSGQADEVYGHHGILRASLQWHPSLKPALMEMMARPGDHDLVKHVVDRALARPGPQRWLVPEYQDDAYMALLSRGLREIGRYQLLVKTMVVKAVERAVATTEATVW